MAGSRSLWQGTRPLVRSQRPAKSGGRASRGRQGDVLLSDGGEPSVILLGDGLVDVLPTVGALLAFAAAFFALGLWRFRFVD